MMRLWYNPAHKSGLGGNEPSDQQHLTPLGGPMRRTALLPLSLLALALCAHQTVARQATQPSAAKNLDQLAWMVGSWAVEHGGMVVEEHWTPARGNTMLAVGRTTRGPRTVLYEFLRI